MNNTVVKKNIALLRTLFLVFLAAALLTACSDIGTNNNEKDTALQTQYQYIEPDIQGSSSQVKDEKEKEPYTIGFTILGEETSFFTNVKESTYKAADQNGVKLLYEVNDRNPENMHDIIDSFVDKGADMIVDFTVLPEEGSEIAANLKDNGIPMLSIDCLYDDAYFFGINNLDAGKTVGRFLATEIVDRWNGKVDALLMLYAEANGEIVKQRVSGAYEGLIESGIKIDSDVVTYININTPTSKQTDKQYVASLVSEYLQSHSEKHIGVVAATDDIALGALAAISESQRMDDILMVSHNCDPTAINNFKEADNCWIGSVNYASTSYGEQIISICVDILNGVEYDQQIYIDAYVVSIYNVGEYFPD